MFFFVLSVLCQAFSIILKVEDAIAQTGKKEYTVEALNQSGILREIIYHNSQEVITEMQQDGIGEAVTVSDKEENHSHAEGRCKLQEIAVH